MTDQEQLAAYRAMQGAVQAEYDAAAEKMAALKAQGKEKNRHLPPAVRPQTAAERTAELVQNLRPGAVKRKGAALP